MLEFVIHGDSAEEIIRQNMALIPSLRDSILKSGEANIRIYHGQDKSPSFSYSISLGEDSSLSIDHIFLSPEYRGSGFGKIYFHYLERIAKRSGCKKIKYFPTFATSEDFIQQLEKNGYQKSRNSEYEKPLAEISL